MIKKVAVLYGGRSGEHEVSLRSAAAVIDGLKQLDNIEVLPIFIDKDGTWLLHGNRVAFLPDPNVGGFYLLEGESAGQVLTVDVVFPVLHGPFGEDGTVQGLLELASLPYVGAGVAGSALGMDKILMKAVLREAGVPVAEHIWFTAYGWVHKEQEYVAAVGDKLGYPCFVKPANLGSSVGVNKAYNSEELRAAVAEALCYDRRVLVEKMLDGLEVECSVLGNDDPQASLPGQIIPCNDFYDYRAKYLDDRTRLIIPAELPPELTEKVRDLAVKTFCAVDCSGYARVDFFVEVESGRIWVNEINTIPGFTEISMFPKLWEASGLPFPRLLQKLLELAEERAQQKEKLKTEYVV